MMVKLNDLIIFGARKSSNSSGLYFSLTKNNQHKNMYIGIRFYFNKSIADKYGLNQNKKIKLACSKDNFRQWFLLINDNEGCSIRTKETRGNCFSCLITFPFEYVENKKMQHVPESSFKYYEKDKILEFSVENIFLKDELVKGKQWLK